MVVTSNGRVLFWETSVRQAKAADFRAYFDIKYTTHVASIHDLKQMKVSFEHKKQGFYYFCSRFEACVELTFYAFNHKDSHRSKFLRTSNPNSYIKAIKSFVTGKVHGNVRQQLDPLVISITSDVRDKAGTPYGFENSEQPLDDMIAMCESLMQEFSNIKGFFFSCYEIVFEFNLL